MKVWTHKSFVRARIQWQSKLSYLGFHMAIDITLYLFLSIILESSPWIYPEIAIKHIDEESFLLEQRMSWEEKHMYDPSTIDWEDLNRL